MFVFRKHRHSYLDLVHINQKIELARDILIANNCEKIYQNPLINAGNRVMAVFFF